MTVRRGYTLDNECSVMVRSVYDCIYCIVYAINNNRCTPVVETEFSNLPTGGVNVSFVPREK